MDDVELVHMGGYFGGMVRNEHYAVRHHGESFGSVMEIRPGLWRLMFIGGSGSLKVKAKGASDAAAQMIAAAAVE